MDRTKTIVVTDGDDTAKAILEHIGEDLGLPCISSSGGNPTPLSEEQIIDEIKKAGQGPVLVMVDDKGSRRKGPGELALEAICTHPDIEVLGVIAVASQTDHISGVPVKISINKEGAIVQGPVDKFGNQEIFGHERVEGDTVDVLNGLNVPLIIGIGDIGKMDGADDISKGAPITKKAIEFILKEAGADLEPI